MWWMSSDELTSSSSSRTKTRGWWWSPRQGPPDLRNPVGRTQTKSSRSWWGAWATPVPARTKTRMNPSCLEPQVNGDGGSDWLHARHHWLGSCFTALLKNISEVQKPNKPKLLMLYKAGGERRVRREKKSHYLILVIALYCFKQESNSRCCYLGDGLLVWDIQERTMHYQRFGLFQCHFNSVFRPFFLYKWSHSR